MIDYEEIRQRVSITTVLGKYASVPDFHRSRYRIPCPLHGGDGSNFKVDEEAGRYYCYTCKSSGDVVALYAAFEHINMYSAALALMKANDISQVDNFTRTWRKTFRQMQWMAKEVAPPALEEGEIPPTEELHGYRSFSRAAVDHFGLRLIPGSGWGCGVYIPVRVEGTLVGYAIRHTDVFLAEHLRRTGHKAPKYLNTEDLGKEGILYGLSENAEAITEAGFCFVVEGQFDCISMWDRGHRNVVAVMGSNLSSHQARQLMAITNVLHLVFDGDEAGRDGMSLIKTQYGPLFQIKTIHLPEGSDPATVDQGVLV